MSFYRWRLQISLAAAAQSTRLVHDEQQRHRILAPPMRLRRALRRLIARAPLRSGLQRSRTTSLVALAFAVLICASPAALADTLDVPGQFAILRVGSAPCTNMRANGKAWGKSEQQRPLAAACAAARIHPTANFHALRHTYASRLAMRGVPLAVIAAQLGHADTRMVERHYGHLAPSYVAETVRAAFGSLGLVEPST
jgi:hypothetical protein